MLWPFRVPPREAVRLWGRMRRAGWQLLPGAGGLLDQDEEWLDAVDYLDARYGRLERDTTTDAPPSYEALLGLPGAGRAGGEDDDA